LTQTLHGTVSGGTFTANPVSTVNYTYDTYGRTSQVQFGAADLNFARTFAYNYTYSQANRILTQSMGWNMYTTAIDEFGRSLSPKAESFSMSYQWDNEGKMTSYNDLQNQPYLYTYDGMGRAANLNPETCAVFDAGGNFERRAPLESGQTKADMSGLLKTQPDAQAVARLASDARYNSLIRTTCVATRISGGHANNALPQLAQANINCRILPGHSPEEIRTKLVAFVDDPQVKVRYVNAGEVFDKAPDTKAFPPLMPSPEILKPLEHVAGEMWPSAPVIPEMETGASDSTITIAAGIPSYGVNGMAIDQDDIRAHGKDERIRVSSYYDGVEFFYRYLKALLGAGK
jgi:acetylornithine deacetylase/succinyl-diaminopimelate desuccinylase-like protein